MYQSNSIPSLRLIKGTLIALVSSVVIFFIFDTSTQVYAVSTLYVSGSGTDNITCGATLGAACRTIKYTVVSRAVDGDTISVQAGTFNENNIVITRSVTIAGLGPSSTIVDGGGTNRVFDVSTGFTVTLAAMTVRNGNAVTGGGVRNAGVLLLSNLHVSDNFSNQGAGIENDGTGALTVISSTISGNSINLTFGAGIYNIGTITITNSTIHGNLGTNGSDGAGLYSAGGTVVITNTTISGNTTDGNGGGLFNSGIGSNMSVYNSTINNNAAASGGGIRITSGTVQLKNTIISNSPSGGNCNGTLTSNGHNLESANTCGFNTGIGDKINTNPLLSGLAQWTPGTTMSHGLLNNSPALNAGDNTGCPSIDQRGVVRPHNGGNPCDIGAFEGALVTRYFPIIRK